MKKKILIPLIAAGIAAVSSISANAQDMNMYVNNQFVVRDIQTVGSFDMLPVLDIAGELGFYSSFDGTTINLYNDSQSFIFTVGNASVYDQNGNRYGLDVVPQVMNGKVRVPAKFFSDVLGKSYTWDSVTNTIFMGSDDTYNWIINTVEYNASNPRYMANMYSSALFNTGYLHSYSYVSGKSESRYFSPYEMWYYMADVNYDGILDLIVSGEDYYSNGIMIYTYKDNTIKQVFDEGIPYSSGVTALTFAECNGRYGIFVHRQNSSDNFTFSYIYSDWSPATDMSGWHYNNEWTINDGRISKDSWKSKFNSIKPIAFYNIWELSGIG